MQARHNREAGQAERHEEGQCQLRREGCCRLSEGQEQRPALACILYAVPPMTAITLGDASTVQPTCHSFHSAHIPGASLLLQQTMSLPSLRRIAECW